MPDAGGKQGSEVKMEGKVINLQAQALSFNGGSRLSIRGMEIQGAPGSLKDTEAIMYQDEILIKDKRVLSDSATGPSMLDPSSHNRAPGRSTWVAGVFHLVTVMIGAGVLSLPNSFAAVGWAVGPVLLAIFGAATVWSSYQLSAVFETPDGKKHFTYKDAVASIMGGHHPVILATILYVCLFLGAMGYTLAGMTSIQFIATTACAWDGRNIAPCPMTSNAHAILLFSGLQLILNVLPNLESIWWVSAIGAAMSYLYSGLAIVLSCHQLSSTGPAPDTSAFGRQASTPWLTAVGMFGALGNLALAWLSGVMLHSIQATLREPPAAASSMNKTIAASYSSTGFLYFSIACLGYAALGAGTPGDMLTGFNSSKEVELTANCAVLLHMVAAVQVFMHPLFEAIEEALARHTPGLKKAMHKSTLMLMASRFGYRALCTAVLTGVAYGLPHFSLISGLNGALTFWPLQIGYPFAMYLKTYPVKTYQRYLMHVTSAFILCVCILATIGSLYALATTS